MKKGKFMRVYTILYHEPLGIFLTTGCTAATQMPHVL